ncbi:MAG TPA: outer membrane protein assembly factor BamA [Pseudomonadota bacterium]|nr:outer membrane protein assembly factor BamA [Xanthomonadales bacterium]HQW63854.1 outer membrane protein assembly factor BamA [Pseudomonadota bacterium]MBP7418086.1 outer membrane protein assembly factor BamA [Xanthomonadales bacterium]HQX25205.1 outer membrane protein assembly factor BamA [Pseudomonadota bacterium]HQY36714.1 outer membrane protein assembly factor BamA [Pseudomonadota bacterium]
MTRFAALVLLAGLSLSATAAIDPFVVQDIRLDGLSRISAGTVYSYLPVEKGDTIDRAGAAEAIRALYKTGFFKDVQVSRQGDILVVTVVERPAIAKIGIDGNKDIKDEDLLKGLKEIGLAEGETFDRLELDRLTQELMRQYNNRGKYNVSIKPTVTELDRNRVEIQIQIAEGKASKIKHLNVVGNTTFSDEEIREDFESDTTGWLSWYSKDDQYSREKLSGDLEKLTSYYQDRGYVDFNIESTQVTISPDKRNIYLTANVREGEVFTISEIKLTGDLILGEPEIRRLVYTQPGDIFSRRKLELSSEAMQKVLGNIGYAFADVTPIPKVDKENRTVEVTFFVNPGKRVYVRRINFEGNTRTQDEVLRREMRQFEGAWFSQAAIDRSKIRLQRLGYFKTVDITTPRVAGSDDQVDVLVKVEEQSSGAFQFGLGYSQLQGLLTSISVTQRNFLGTGNSVGVTLQNNSVLRRFDFSYIDPYFTDDGVSLGYTLSYRELDQGEANIANYTSDIASGSVIMGIPLTETDTLSMVMSLSRNQIGTFPGITPPEIIDYINELGKRTFSTWGLQAGWSRDSRNKYFAPTRGAYQRVGAEVALPGSTQEAYKLFYEGARYWPLGSIFSLLTRAELGYGDGYGNADVLPFYENFYAGGVRSVRGFEDNTLGPCSDPNPLIEGDICQPLGGALLTVANLELIFPTPFVKRGDDSTQFSAFVDVGNVFEDYDAFDVGELRASAGISFKWQAPVGPIIVSIAYPLIKEDEDRTETLQFTFGNQF